MSDIVAIVLLSNHAYLILNNNRYMFIPQALPLFLGGENT